MTVERVRALPEDHFARLAERESGDLEIFGAVARLRAETAIDHLEEELPLGAGGHAQFQDRMRRYRREVVTPRLYDAFEDQWFGRFAEPKHAAWVVRMGGMVVWREWVGDEAPEAARWDRFCIFVRAAVADVLDEAHIGKTCPACRGAPQAPTLTASHLVRECPRARAELQEMLLSAGRGQPLPQSPDEWEELLLGMREPRRRGWGAWENISILGGLRSRVRAWERAEAQVARSEELD